MQQRDFFKVTAGYKEPLSRRLSFLVLINVMVEDDNLDEFSRTTLNPIFYDTGKII
jgi:hypothetical protein